MEVKRGAVEIESETQLKWYQSSAKVRRGFCADCGSSLFIDPIDQTKHDWIAVALGAFDEPTQVKLWMHIFVAEKGGYYELDGGLPQNHH